MALKFFKMSERGGVTRPTIPAVIAFMVLMPFEAFILLDSPFIAVFIVWPGTWVAVSVMLSSPVRVVIAKIMHYTRENKLYSLLDNDKYKLWLETHKKTFEKTGVKIYEGEKD